MPGRYFRFCSSFPCRRMVPMIYICAGQPRRCRRSAAPSRTSGRLVARIDILETLPGQSWRLCEVKTSAEVKGEHIYDCAFQLNAARPRTLSPANGSAVAIAKTISGALTAAHIDRNVPKDFAVLTETTEECSIIAGVARAKTATLDEHCSPKLQRKASIPFVSSSTLNQIESRPSGP
jgi:hypothetical protein